MIYRQEKPEIEIVAFTTLNPALRTYPNIFEGDVLKLVDGLGTDQENLIEYAGRVCYRSTARMGSAPKFIINRVKEGHEDIVEHVVVTLKVKNMGDVRYWMMVNRHLNISNVGDPGVIGEFGEYLVTANVRVWLDLFRKGICLEAIPLMKSLVPSVFAEFKLIDASGGKYVNLLDWKSAYLTTSDGPMKVTLLGVSVPNSSTRYGQSSGTLMKHGAATFLFEGISRACTHQLVRHRLASFSQESQRYTKYDAVKHNLSPKVPKLPTAQKGRRHGLCKFSIDQEKFIVEQYQKGFNGEILSREYDVDPVTIRSIVKRHGVEYRNVRQSRSQHIETDFFDRIDTPLKAQILGLIYADGNVARRGEKISHATISQHSDYKCWMKRLGELWGGSVISGGKKNASVLTVPGLDLANALVSHGVVPNKSKILTHPNIDDELARHFIRGYLEGDGYISKQSSNPSIVFVGTENVLSWIKEKALSALGKQKGPSIKSNGSVYSLSFSGSQQVPKMIEWIYEGFDFRYSHPAKLERATEWCESINEEFISQRIEWGKRFGAIVPNKFTPITTSIFISSIEEQAQSYANLRQIGIYKEDARFLLPNAVETRIITTMSYEAWSHFLWLRALDKAAQWEIRKLGQIVLGKLYDVSPIAFEEHWRTHIERFTVNV